MSISFADLNHPMRVSLAAEAHSRPFMKLGLLESLTHLGLYASGTGPTAANDNARIQHTTLSALCTHFGVAAPGVDAKYFFHDFGRFRLKWECHTEFATYTFAQCREDSSSVEQAFERVPLLHIPQAWLAGLHEQVMIAAHVVLADSHQDLSDEALGLPRAFEGNLLAGCRTAQGGEIWTDFLIQSDGFSRFVVRCGVSHEHQSGRLVQRVLEIETYRIMALLGLPQAQEAAPTLNEIEAELARLTENMVTIGDKIDGLGSSNRRLSDADGERSLLHDITTLAARMEKLALDNNYRFSASKAYFNLVQSRIEELGEGRIDGVPTMAEFMDRRLRPAMNTCESIARRQEALAERIGHTNDLLRTRVGIVQEQQNREILHSMNNRAAQQLRLQQAVEGLSVAAISYYVIGLFSYVAKAAKGLGLPINTDIATGMLIPIVAVAVWLGLRRMHKSIHVS